MHKSVLLDAQFGFRHNCSTEQAIHNSVNRIYLSMDREYCIYIYIYIYIYIWVCSWTYARRSIR